MVTLGSNSPWTLHCSHRFQILCHCIRFHFIFTTSFQHHLNGAGCQTRSQPGASGFSGYATTPSCPCVAGLQDPIAPHSMTHQVTQPPRSDFPHHSKATRATRGCRTPCNQAYQETIWFTALRSWIPKPLFNFSKIQRALRLGKTTKTRPNSGIILPTGLRNQIPSPSSFFYGRTFPCGVV